MKKYLFREDANQIILLENFDAIDFNEISSLIFRLAEQGACLNNIVEIIKQEYQIDHETAFRDTKELLKKLAKFGVRPDKNKQKQIKIPIVHILENCNSPCMLCDCWKSRSSIQHPSDLLKKYFCTIKKMGAEKIMLSGGEPLLHKNLKDIILSIKKLDLKVMLNTNGLLLHKNTWLHELDIDEIVVSMDGLNQEDYKELRGLDRFNQVWINLQKFKKYSPNTIVGIRSILHKKNYLKIDKMVEILLKNRCDFLGLSPLDINSNSFSRKNMNQKRSLELANNLLPNIEEIKAFERLFKPSNRYFDFIEQSFNDGIIGWNAKRLANCMSYYKKLWTQEDISGSWTCTFPIFSMPEMLL